MTIAPVWQTFLFGSCACVAIAMQATMDLNPSSQFLILAPLIAVFGLPHGALDLPIAERLWPLEGVSGKLKFIASYVGLILLVIAVWLVAPGVALSAFLAYSALHFSGDWAGTAAPLRWAGGVAAIGAPALLHPTEVTALFGHLAPLPAAAIAADAAALAGALAIIPLALTLAIRRRLSQPVIELMILWIAAWLLPPLLFFGIYFCSLHSIRHYRSSIRRMPSARRALFTAIGLSSIVALAGVSFVLVRSVADPAVPFELGLQAVFIGLAALTVPHMILVERFDRRLFVTRVGQKNTGDGIEPLPPVSA
ncbi:Brp/Blh family beta-carotene 15,15'-dioxygenase [Aquisalinus flavus]|nr:Brp/Blh family beta-carotene 15,15'-dioxygenase [Aquisalinus flavus]MBD0427889.1 Brp/Blh family beta-carotene 15,15'-dioxygenase [Aquisalinus flavus]